MNRDFEPIDLDERMTLRAAVLLAWASWDEQPGNDARANAYADACVAYCGDAHNDYRRNSSASRRAGIDRPTALERWEADW